MATVPRRFSTESSLRGPRATEVLDEAVSLLRQIPLSLLSIYYLGALPFCLGLIYFWFDMTQSADAEAHLPGEALLLTGCYLWMKTGQAGFARKLLAFLEGDETDEWNVARWMNTALLQAIYAGSFVIVYPLAVIIGLPFGWVSCFYHNISIVATGPKSTVRSAFKEATELSVLWPKQNHLILAILLAGVFILFLNLAVVFILVPELLNMLFGIETVFDQNMFAWNNSSFYLDVSVFCFLILNPLNKAIYALRCFYGRARLNGADLKSALRRYQMTRGQKVPVRALALVLMLGLLSGGNSLQAEDAPSPPQLQKANSVDPSALKLDQSIEATLKKDEFAWRLPRLKVKDDQEGWLARLLTSVLTYCKEILHPVAKWLAGWMKWLLERDPTKQDSSPSSWQGLAAIPWRLIGILFAVLGVLVLLYWLMNHFRLKSAQALVPVTTAAVRTVDLEAEDVRADDLPEDSWLALAQQMIERGEMRLALRAFYLATLSVLAQQQLVRLGAAKSNRDYLQELTRRLRGNASVVGSFRENVGLFEASWYGTHAVTAAMIETMRTNHHQMRTHAAP